MMTEEELTNIVVVLALCAVVAAVAAAIWVFVRLLVELLP